MSKTRQLQAPPNLGIALGSGSARGLAHIGVLRELERIGIEPTIVCGTSIGALIGAVYACGQLEAFESWIRRLTIKEMIRHMDVSLLSGGGVADGTRLIDFCKAEFGDHRIEQLAKPFAAVATDLNTGREIWLREGSLWDGVRSSIALPGLLTPVRSDAHWVVDGGLVNPVPVSVCRAMDAETIIAVNLNGDIVGRHLRKTDQANREQRQAGSPPNLLERLTANIREKATPMISQLLRSPAESDSPGLLEVLSGSINIMQDRITRSRLAGEPADILLAPRLAHIGLLEFDRAGEIIEEGRHCVRSMLPMIEDSLRVRD
jgi:NTE family protein